MTRAELEAAMRRQVAQAISAGRAGGVHLEKVVDTYTSVLVNQAEMYAATQQASAAERAKLLARAEEAARHG